MNDTIDLILSEMQEPEPFDEGFVQRVMGEVRIDEQRRVGRRSIRRPVVFGIAAAVVVTGGAVAAVVGTNPTRERVAPPKISAPASVHVSKPPTAVPATPRQPSAVKQRAPVAKEPVKEAVGYLTEHTAWAFDAAAGLRLTTESYTTEFTAGRAQRVTMTLENTGSRPISFEATRGCALQVMAIPKGGDVAEAYTDPQEYRGNFEWVCAGSDADPRLHGFTEDFVLEPGERKTADAFVTLDKPGSWNVFGTCRCTYHKVDGSPSPKTDPLTDLFRRALPDDLLAPHRNDGKDLATPPIGVRAR